MDPAADIAEFLTTRRAKVTPQQAGLPVYGKRRVPGLRREEVASLAGVSVEYYRRLERGNVSGVSELVLEALARALQLDDAERAHLLDLARAAGPVALARPRPPKTRVRPVVHRLLEQIEAPAVVSTIFGDYLAANRRNVHDLIGQLSTRSEEFRVRWAAHNVRFHQTGTKRLQHPIVGELTLAYETLTLDADAGLRLALYTADAGSASQQGLDLLASWAATPSADERVPGDLRKT